jgi:hypothetical protein
MLKRTLFVALAASGTLAFSTSAQAAYVTLGTTNTSNTTTALSGNTTGSELLVKNTNGSSASAFSLYGLLSATSPTVTAAAVRGQNGSTNARGYGVWGSQNGTGTGVYGYTPGGKGVSGNSLNGIGVAGSHTGTSANSAAGVQGQSAGSNGTGVKGVATSGGYAKGVWGVSDTGYGGFFEAPGSVGYGVYASGGEFGVRGESPSSTGIGVYGRHTSSTGTAPGVEGDTSSQDRDGAIGVLGRDTSSTVIYPGAGVWGMSGNGNGVVGTGGQVGVDGESVSGDGLNGSSTNATGLYAYSQNEIGVRGATSNSSSYAGYFYGNVLITHGTCTGCTGPSALHIDDPLDPAHKYLNHASVASSQQLDVYSGNVTTNGRGFATVTMPRWFQALNRSFRYQLTVIGKPGQFVQAMVVKEMAHNRFRLETSKPNAKVSWQVTAVRHDRSATAPPMRVIAPKPKADQGKYVNPQLYGKPRSDGIGYRTSPRLGRTEKLPPLPNGQK